VDRTGADEFGFSRQEADELASPLPLLHPKNLYFKMQKALMKLTSRWSKGLKIGEETGYDSGSTLDYVYQNEPQGSNAFGKWVDKNYLNSIGWRGIRQRKENIKIALQQAISLLKEQQKPVHLLDIASGHGRYILDALSDHHQPDSIRLRDYSSINVAAGNKLIEERGLSAIATFVEKNAFAAESYQNLEVKPTLGVVSGLLELFPNNELISIALKGFGDVIESGGYLIYTNQPYHPQLEMIARCLSSHRDGEAWVMRRRSQQEMDQLVARAGFEKVCQWIDGDGIFSVSLAVKK
ncbi:MAG TPA: hypothetical protein DD638_02815, partial [Pasteurellaceae bacterium]|nr:hypothetical protein [Pasteurellaceae bacterium]